MSESLYGIIESVIERENKVSLLSHLIDNLDSLDEKVAIDVKKELIKNGYFIYRFINDKS